MKVIWCWRCKMEVPMLDEKEFAVVATLASDCISSAKHFREKHGTTLAESPIQEIFRPVREAYKQMTGMDEANHNAVMHHRLSLYGPACQYCGKPLRTPRASFCAACGKEPRSAVAEA